MSGFEAFKILYGRLAYHNKARISRVFRQWNPKQFYPKFGKIELSKNIKSQFFSAKVKNK